MLEISCFKMLSALFCLKKRLASISTSACSAWRTETFCLGLTPGIAAKHKFCHNMRIQKIFQKWPALKCQGTFHKQVESNCGCLGKFKYVRLKMKIQVAASKKTKVKLPSIDEFPSHYCNWETQFCTRSSSKHTACHLGPLICMVWRMELQVMTSSEHYPLTRFETSTFRSTACNANGLNWLSFLLAKGRNLPSRSNK